MSNLPTSEELVSKSLKQSDYRSNLSKVRGYLNEAIGSSGDSASIKKHLNITRNEIQSTSTNYTVLVEDTGKVIRFTGTNSLSCTLLSASVLGNGWSIILVNDTINDLNVILAGAEKIENTSPYILPSGYRVELMTDGVNIFPISEYEIGHLNNHTHTTATTSIDGYMSKEDKSKLDGIEEGATASDPQATYTHTFSIGDWVQNDNYYTFQFDKNESTDIPISCFNTNGSCVYVDIYNNTNSIQLASISAFDGYVKVLQKNSDDVTVDPIPHVTNVYIVDGSTSIPSNGYVVFNISNYDINRSYSITPILGTVGPLSSNGDFKWTPKNSLGIQGVVVDGTRYEINVTSGDTNVPNITAPVNNSIGLSAISATLIGSSFSYVGVSRTHKASQWQLATDSGFANIAIDSGEDTTNKTRYTVTGLNNSTVYYIRLRYKDSLDNWSGWSSVIKTTTVASSVPVSTGELMRFFTEEANTTTINEDGSLIALGFPMISVDTVAYKGKVFIFRKDPDIDSWTQEASLTKTTGYLFGSAMNFDNFNNGLMIFSNSSLQSDNNPIYDNISYYKYDSLNSVWNNIGDATVNRLALSGKRYPFAIKFNNNSFKTFSHLNEEIEYTFNLNNNTFTIDSTTTLTNIAYTHNYKVTVQYGYFTITNEFGEFIKNNKLTVFKKDETGDYVEIFNQENAIPDYHNSDYFNEFSVFFNENDTYFGITRINYGALSAIYKIENDLVTKISDVPYQSFSDATIYKWVLYYFLNNDIITAICGSDTMISNNSVKTSALKIENDILTTIDTPLWCKPNESISDNLKYKVSGSKVYLIG